MPDQSTMTRSGLFMTGEETEPIPLAGVSIEGEIHTFFAKVVVSQRYVNRESKPIEAVYVFPLDEGAAVCGFEAVIDGTLVVGEVLERDEAFERYDEAMQAGHGAYLLDEERPDVFQASIGNLPPGKEVLVRLTYVTELGIDDGRVRFAIPTTVSPRYAPLEDHQGTGRPDAEALNPPVAWRVPYGLNLSIRIAMPEGLTGIESPSHPVSLTMSGKEATVTLAQREAALDRDFVLSIDAPGLDSPHVLIERDEDGGEAIAVSFAPSFASPAAPAEVIFLVDRSGSMGGTSIEEVRNALQLCLRSMTPACRFNIVGFGSQHQTLFPESRAYDQAALDAATAHVAVLDADLGGTEILPALDFVLKQKPHRELPRQVVVLTDGEVSNTDAVIALAASHAAEARIFTFGIGAGASHHLVRGLARAGGGTAEFIYPGERIEPKVLRQFGRLLSPAVTDARLEWVDAGSVTQSPVRIPPVFANGRLIVYALVKGQRPSKVRLNARSPAGPLAFEVPLSDEAMNAGRTVSTLSARARIRELEESPEWLTGRGSRQKGRKDSSARREIIALSVKYGVMSRETSFVAVERRETPVQEEVQLRKVPIALTTGWGRQEQRLIGRRRLSATAPASRLIPFDGVGEAVARRASPSGRSSSDSAPAIAYSLDPQAMESFEPLYARRVRRVPSAMQALVVLQAADGSWALTRELASVMGRDLADLRTALAGASGVDGDVERAWATALAIAWLERNAPDEFEQWKLLAQKGRVWIDRSGTAAPAGSHWMHAAHEFLR